MEIKEISERIDQIKEEITYFKTRTEGIKKFLDGFQKKRKFRTEIKEAKNLTNTFQNTMIKLIKKEIIVLICKLPQGCFSKIEILDWKKQRKSIKGIIIEENENSCIIALNDPCGVFVFIKDTFGNITSRRYRLRLADEKYIVRGFEILDRISDQIKRILPSNHKFLKNP